MKMNKYLSIIALSSLYFTSLSYSAPGTNTEEDDDAYFEHSLRTQSYLGSALDSSPANSKKHINIHKAQSAPSLSKVKSDSTNQSFISSPLIVRGYDAGRDMLIVK
jgi:hypothetical protein